MRTLSRSMEQVAVAIAVAILALISLSFALSHQLGDSHQTRFLFSGVVLALTCLYLRFGLHRIQPLHRASYRIAVVMMIWAMGLYFFPYPQFVLYLVAIPGFYFLYRIESKQRQAPGEDKIATGLLFTLAVFLYIQQQPLQVILFSNSEFDWQAYYQNAPCMLLVGLALLRFQFWIKWDGIATLATLLVVAAIVLTLSLLASIDSRWQWLPLRELVFLVLTSHLVLAFLFIPNPLYKHFTRVTGIDGQALDYRSSVFWSLFAAGQVAVLLLLQPYWQAPVDTSSGDFNQRFYHHPGNARVGSVWLLPLVLINLALPLYHRRSWTVSLVCLETAAVAGLLAVRGDNYDLPAAIVLWALAAVAGLLFSMVWLKRRYASRGWIHNWSYGGVLAAYAFVFVQTDMFSLAGLLGFLLPVVSWALLPERPFAKVRRFEVYFWPLAAGIIVLCLTPDKSPRLLNDWALLVIAAPLALCLALTNVQLRMIVRQRGWPFLRRWQRLEGSYLRFFALLVLAICAASFWLNQAWFASAWPAVIQAAAALLLCAGATLFTAVQRRAVAWVLATELTLWLTIALLRWKLEVVEALQLGTPIDGYVFIGVAILVAGLREKVRRHSAYLGAYFIKSTLVYSLIGWSYLVYLHIVEQRPLHGELASLLLAGLYYWLSRGAGKSLHVLVFLFANMALFFYFADQELNNALLYLTPALGSVLVLTQLFKEELSTFQIRQIRLFCGLILLGVSAAYNILDFRASIWYPVTAAMMSAAIVVTGISLRIRIFLFLGSAFFFVNIVGMIANVIITQPAERTMFAVGILFLCTGVVFILSYLLFQMKRQEILRRYNNLKEHIEMWE